MKRDGDLASIRCTFIMFGLFVKNILPDRHLADAAYELDTEAIFMQLSVAVSEYC